ncbi:uncharacterized protein EAF01_004083 [Botrytis porri]|uniref:uncharacterized protein n=1 Tax=Botrytis porri TaxID=87229 RepID=UPI0019009E43|nr:uncharacterized protein EAF01_004083 [Botrytis porri]KAF7908328.1 hypothetical protein EAF01_004083 [Botrytis porri]
MGTSQRESRRTAPSIKRRLVDGAAASGLLQTTARNQSQLNINLTQRKHRREEKRRKSADGDK